MSGGGGAGGEYVKHPFGAALLGRYVKPSELLMMCREQFAATELGASSVVPICVPSRRRRTRALWWCAWCDCGLLAFSCGRPR